MKTFKLVQALFLMSGLLGCSGDAEDGVAASVETARYQVTFTSLWNATDHVSVPGSAHFSPLVVTVHNSDHTLMSTGFLASPGLEGVAETGSTAIINIENAEDESDGSVFASLNTQDLTVAPGASFTFTIEVVSSHPLVSVVNMIAPSPDWIVGLDGLSLYNDGSFTEATEEISLFAYNAGTEDGDTAGNYSIDNSATANPTPVSRLSGAGFDEPFAKIIFEKL